MMGIIFICNHHSLSIRQWKYYARPVAALLCKHERRRRTLLGERLHHPQDGLGDVTLVSTAVEAVLGPQQQHGGAADRHHAEHHQQPHLQRWPSPQHKMQLRIIFNVS